ncbi:MAG: zf-TFIIB domain-containing protein [Pseudanabaenaceae cyanobacterium bins.68]|nr:zf-TFIIB domain-containing protein [Pseudanabaenaceae cyanobacterium bins.68]
MRCPKHKDMELELVELSDQTPRAYTCACCEGKWIAADDYQAWQKGEDLQQPVFLPDAEMEYVPSDLDVKGGLCPECGSYLTRLKVFYTLKRSFYLERCAACGGFWCDRGEWQVLQQLGQDRQLPQLFSTRWQILVREQQKIELERQMVVDKLGEELATQLFDLIGNLADHPQGEFAVNYLSRQVRLTN